MITLLILTLININGCGNNKINRNDPTLSAKIDTYTQTNNTIPDFDPPTYGESVELSNEVPVPPPIAPNAPSLNNSMNSQVKNSGQLNLFDEMSNVNLKKTKPLAKEDVSMSNPRSIADDAARKSSAMQKSDKSIEERLKEDKAKREAERKSQIEQRNSEIFDQNKLKKTS